MLYPVSFQPESPQQATPVLNGMQMAQQMYTNALKNQQLQMQNKVMPQSLQAALQQQLLKNAQLGIQNQYLPAQSQANIGLTQAQARAQNALPGLYGAEGAEAMAKVPLYGAQASLANQQAKMYPYTIAANLDPVTKMLIGRQLYGQISGAGNSPLGQTGGNASSPALPGVSNAPQPNSPPATASVGGYSFSPIPQGALSPSGNQPAANVPGANINDLYGLQLKNTILGMGKNPTMGSYRSGAGGTYIDPFTGQTVSTDTTQQTTQDQRTITGVQNAQQYLDEARQNMQNFVTPWQKAALHLAQIGNASLGGNSPLPSQYAAGKANITQAAEGIIKTFGLNATNENVNKVIDIMTPKYGETTASYNSRVMQEINNLAQQGGRASSRLGSGFSLNNTATNSMIRVKTPDGRTGSIPANNLQAALQAGYTQVQ